MLAPEGPGLGPNCSAGEGPLPLGLPAHRFLWAIPAPPNCGRMGKGSRAWDKRGCSRSGQEVCPEFEVRRSVV